MGQGPVLENRIRTAMKAGRKAMGFSLNFPAPYIVELLGLRGGFDFAFLDGEHGAIDARDIEEFCRTCDLVGLTPTARVPDSTKAGIGRFLDRGIRGIVVPHVCSAEEARAIVAHTRFAPEGSRSYGAGRSERLGHGLEDLPAHCKAWNETVKSCGVVSTLMQWRVAPSVIRASVIVPPVSMSIVSIGRLSSLRSRGPGRTRGSRYRCSKVSQPAPGPSAGPIP